MWGTHHVHGPYRLADNFELDIHAVFLHTMWQHICGWLVNLGLAYVAAYMLAEILIKMYSVLVYTSIHRQCIIAYMQHRWPVKLTYMLFKNTICEHIC